MPNITLSVFQALTLLAEKYRHDEHKKNRFDFIKRIYLTGAHTAAYRESLKILLQDPYLKKFNISTTKHDINEDPVRRYFESHLAHNTLEASLDDLDILLLHENFHVIFKLLQRSDHAEFCTLINQHPPRPYVFFDEYLDGLFQLHQPKSYRSLSPRETGENQHTNMIISMPEPHKPQANHSIFSPPHHQYDKRSRKRFNPELMP